VIGDATASRAEESLALVCYTDSPARLTSSLVAQGWFEEEEVELPR